MYYVQKTLEIAGAHSLNLDYESKCSNLHGHNWLVTVYCKAKELDQNGMVVDFAEIKRKVSEHFDHKFLNELMPGKAVGGEFMRINPTAENLARLICDNVPHCYKVTVQESSGNIACYEED